MSENTIVILAENNDEQTLKTTKRTFENNDNRVIIEEYPRAKSIRGYPADVVILLDSISKEDINKTIKPMVSVNDGQIIDLSN